MTFVFTGRAIIDGLFFERKYLEDLAREKHHEVQSHVDWLTDYIVVGVNKYKTRKITAASANGTKVITPKEFLNMMGI